MHLYALNINPKLSLEMGLGSREKALREKE